MVIFYQQNELKGLIINIEKENKIFLFFHKNGHFAPPMR